MGHAHKMWKALTLVYLLLSVLSLQLAAQPAARATATGSGTLDGLPTAEAGDASGDTGAELEAIANDPYVKQIICTWTIFGQAWAVGPIAVWRLRNCEGYEEEDE